MTGRTPAEVWGRFPNGPMPADFDEAESQLFTGETADPTSGGQEGEVAVVFAGGTAVWVVLL